MFNRVLALVLVGVLVWGVVQGIRKKRLSYFATAAMGLFLLLALGGRRPVFYAAALVAIGTRWYLLSRERRLDWRAPARTVHDGEPRAEPIRARDVAPRRDERPEPSAARGFTALALRTERATVPCDGGELRIEAGELRVKVRFEHEHYEEVDRVRSRLVLADSEGREWQLQSYFDAALFTDALEDGDRRAAIEAEDGFVFWTDAPEIWKDALRERCLLAGVRDLMDSRSYVELRIGSRPRTLRMKHQGPTVDVGVLGPDLVVRVSELIEVVFEGSGSERTVDGDAPLPAFAWRAPGDALLCFAEPPRHRSELEEVEEMLEPEECKPSVAKRLETRGEPQPSVMFRAA